MHAMKMHGEGFALQPKAVALPDKDTWTAHHECHVAAMLERYASLIPSAIGQSHVWRILSEAGNRTRGLVRASNGLLNRFQAAGIWCVSDSRAIPIARSTH